jgi:hypothetical protein
VPGWIVGRHGNHAFIVEATDVSRNLTEWRIFPPGNLGEWGMYLPESPDAKRPPLLYFCDESHIRTSEWMGIGGLAITPARAALVAKEMHRLKEARGVSSDSEVKWTKAKSKPEICRDYLDLMERLIANNHAHFHVRFAPFQEYDHRVSGKRKETDTVSKAYYQLLLHRAGRFYGRQAKILVRPDAGDCTSDLPKLMAAVNVDLRLRYNVPHDAITHIQARDSRDEPMLQLLDVALGALTAARNGGHRNGTLSAIKANLAAYALEKCPVPIDHNHEARHKRFSLWNVKPKWRKGAVPTR